MKKVIDKWGMKMHWGKTKVMIVSRTEEKCKLSIEGEDIEDVKKLKFLGAMISADGMCDTEQGHTHSTMAMLHVQVCGPAIPLFVCSLCHGSPCHGLPWKSAKLFEQRT